MMCRPTWSGGTRAGTTRSSFCVSVNPSRRGCRGSPKAKECQVPPRAVTDTPTLTQRDLESSHGWWPLNVKLSSYYYLLRILSFVRIRCRLMQYQYHGLVVLWMLIQEGYFLKQVTDVIRQMADMNIHIIVVYKKYQLCILLTHKTRIKPHTYIKINIQCNREPYFSSDGILKYVPQYKVQEIVNLKKVGN